MQIPADEQNVGASVSNTATPPDTPDITASAVPSVVVIAGLKIPGDQHRDWESAFKEIDLQAAILQRARWALRLPEGRRLRSLQTALAKLNDEARIARMDRVEKRQAELEQGVERCRFTGRIKGAPHASKFQIPRHRPTPIPAAA